MADVEKIISGIASCEPSKIKRNCSDCPYREEMNCDYVLWHDALDLVQEQQRQIEQMNFIYGFVYGGQVKDIQELIRCKDCKYCYVDGDNVRFNMCLLNHNKVQADDWFCADGEKR